MTDSMYSKETCMFLYELINTQGDVYDIYRLLSYMLSDQDESLSRQVIKRCTKITAVYESLISGGYTGDLWEAFISRIERYERSGEWLVDPMSYAHSGSFKLKCIVTLAEIRRNDFKTMEEAVYKVCSSESYKTLESVILNAKDAEDISKGKHIFVGCAGSVMLLTTLYPIGILLGIADGVSYAVKRKLIGKIKLTQGYNKALRDKESVKKSVPCVDYSQEYFDPTYVNM